MKRRTVLWAALFALTLMACDDGSVNTTVIESSVPTIETTIEIASIGDSVRGEEIAMIQRGSPGGVLESACVRCHTFDADEMAPGEKGTGKGIAPRLEGIGLVAGERAVGLSAEEYLRQSITDPQVHIAGDPSTNMPTGLKYLLTEEDVNDVVAFLLTLQ